MVYLGYLMVHLGYWMGYVGHGEIHRILGGVCGYLRGIGGSCTLNSTSHTANAGHCRRTRKALATQRA